MADTGVPVAAPPARRVSAAWGVGLFVAVSVVGLYLAKWHPYYGKAFVAAAHHSLGASIVSGSAAAAPAAGWTAAWRYALAYGKDIWLALVVGLLMGSGVQALLPRDWLLRLLGGGRLGGTVRAGLASVPSMM